MIALVIGHTKKRPGACNKKHGVCEFEFNDDLTSEVGATLDMYGIESKQIYRRTYRGLPSMINKHNPEAIVSFHCNAFNRQASGSEVLYYRGSDAGKELAAQLQHQIVDSLWLPDRGIKPRGVEDRGGYLLRYTKAPCVIIEPFFIDNDSDYEMARDNLGPLAAGISLGIYEFYRTKLGD